MIIYIKIVNEYLWRSVRFGYIFCCENLPYEMWSKDQIELAVDSGKAIKIKLSFLCPKYYPETIFYDIAKEVVIHSSSLRLKGPHSLSKHCLVCLSLIGLSPCCRITLHLILYILYCEMYYGM